MIDLTGQRAFVTGGSRGVGRAVAVMLARAGADVALGFRSRSDDAATVVAEIEDLDRTAVAVGGDLSDAATAHGVIERAVGVLGGLDIVVANAGIWPANDAPLRDMSDEQWARTHATNLDAMFFTLRSAIPHLGEGGRIVMVSSTAGQRGEALHADYASTKGALISLTKSLAVELAPRITVNCVAPGWIDTEMSEVAYADGGRERIAATIPLRRVASAAEIAGPIVFLCSDLASYVTGEIVNVNGGNVLCG